MGKSNFSPRKRRPRHLPVSCSVARIFFQIKQCTRALTLSSARVYDKGRRFLLFPFWFPLFSWDVLISLQKQTAVSDAAKWNHLAPTSYTRCANNTVHQEWSGFLFFNTNLPRTQYFSLNNSFSILNITVFLISYVGAMCIHNISSKYTVHIYV